MSRASEKVLDSLHGALAKALADAIKEGITVIGDDGKAVKNPAPAQLLNVARQFLKDNKIEATGENEGLNDIASALKKMDLDDLDDLDGSRPN